MKLGFPVGTMSRDSVSRQINCPDAPLSTPYNCMESFQSVLKKQ